MNGIKDGLPNKDQHLINRIYNATRVENEKVLEIDPWMRTYLGLFGCAISLIASHNLVEERNSNKLGGFRSFHAKELHSNLETMIENFLIFKKLEWDETDSMKVWSGGYFLNNAIQRLAITTEHLVNFLYEISYPNEKLPKNMPSRLEGILKTDIPDRLTVVLSALSFSFKKYNDAPKLRLTIETEIIKYPSIQTLNEVVTNTNVDPSTAVVYCWSRSNIWKHHSKGTHERSAHVSKKRGNASLLEWAWTLFGLEKLCTIWNSASEYVSKVYSI